MIEEANILIKKLNLLPHPEGGYFNEVYRSAELIQKKSLPERYNGSRNFSTSIYFLLVENQVSLFHRIHSDEIWHFYKGSPVIIHCLNEKGYYSIKLGNQSAENEKFQYVIKANTWFAAEVENKNSYSLLGCTVAPGFDFADFQLAKRSKLIKLFPDRQELISKFTKE